MPGSYDSYPWDGAPWDGIMGAQVISTAHSFCFAGVARWELSIDGSAVIWMTGDDAIEITGTAHWELEVMGAIPEC